MIPDGVVPARKGLPVAGGSGVNTPVPVLIAYAETLLEPLLDTNKKEPLGVIVIPLGAVPVGKGFPVPTTNAVNVPVAGLIE